MENSLLSKWFQRAGSSMRMAAGGDEHAGFKSLIQLARDLRKKRVFMTDPSERCIAFLTERYIVAVHGNLFMDTPFSDELQKARAHLLEIIGGSLEVMAQGLIDKDYQKVYESLGEAVSCYLETIENLNASYQSNLSERQGGVE